MATRMGASGNEKRQAAPAPQSVRPRIGRRMLQWANEILGGDLALIAGAAVGGVTVIERTADVAQLFEERNDVRYLAPAFPQLRRMQFQKQVPIAAGAQALAHALEHKIFGAFYIDLRQIDLRDRQLVQDRVQRPAGNRDAAGGALDDAGDT